MIKPKNSAPVNYYTEKMSKRYNDENTNYTNVMPRRGNAFGVEGQLGCSLIEIDKKKFKNHQNPEKKAKKVVKRPHYVHSGNDDEDEFEINVTKF